jgi:hypothetical protein
MRTLLLVAGAALFVFGAPSSATAMPSLSDEVAGAANSTQKIDVRLAAAGGNNNGKGNAGANNKNNAGGNPGCEKRAEIVSPSKHPNNGFGNCGGDGVPGKSGKQDDTR